jgi:hypothetical protein
MNAALEGIGIVLLPQTLAIVPTLQRGSDHFPLKN